MYFQTDFLHVKPFKKNLKNKVSNNFLLCQKSRIKKKMEKKIRQKKKTVKKFKTGEFLILKRKEKRNFKKLSRLEWQF